MVEGQLTNDQLIKDEIEFTDLEEHFKDKNPLDDPINDDIRDIQNYRHEEGNFWNFYVILLKIQNLPSSNAEKKKVVTLKKSNKDYDDEGVDSKRDPKSVTKISWTNKQLYLAATNISPLIMDLLARQFERLNLMASIYDHKYINDRIEFLSLLLHTSSDSNEIVNNLNKLKNDKIYFFKEKDKIILSTPSHYFDPINLQNISNVLLENNNTKNSSILESDIQILKNYSQNNNNLQEKTKDLYFTLNKLISHICVSYNDKEWKNKLIDFPIYMAEENQFRLKDFDEVKMIFERSCKLLIDKIKEKSIDDNVNIIECITQLEEISNGKNVHSEKALYYFLLKKYSVIINDKLKELTKECTVTSISIYILSDRAACDHCLIFLLDSWDELKETFIEGATCIIEFEKIKKIYSFQKEDNSLKPMNMRVKEFMRFIDDANLVIIPTPNLLSDINFIRRRYFTDLHDDLNLTKLTFFISCNFNQNILEGYNKDLDLICKTPVNKLYSSKLKTIVEQFKKKIFYLNKGINFSNNKD